MGLIITSVHFLLCNRNWLFSDVNPFILLVLLNHVSLDPVFNLR